MDNSKLIQKYHDIGIECLVIWDDEIEARKQEIISFITLVGSGYPNGGKIAISA